MTNTHRLKVWPSFYEGVENGKKLAEFRDDDKGFKVGDTLDLCEFEPADGWTGRHRMARIIWIDDLSNLYGMDRFVKPVQLHLEYVSELKSVNWHVDCGRMGSLSGLFSAHPLLVAAICAYGPTVRLGEVLGKHSDIQYVFGEDDFEIGPTDSQCFSGIDVIESLQNDLCEDRRRTHLPHVRILPRIRRTWRRSERVLRTYCERLRRPPQPPLINRLARFMHAQRALLQHISRPRTWSIVHGRYGLIIGL